MKNQEAVSNYTAGAKKGSFFGFVLVCCLVIGFGLSGLLVLNITLQTQGFKVSAAQAKAKELTDRAEYLQSEVNRLRSPVEIGERAAKLGMIPNGKTVYLKVPSGEVITGMQSGIQVVKKKQ